MPITYGKIVRALYLVLFTASSIISFFNFHTNAVTVAGLSLVGFIAFDVICQLKKPTPAPDHSAAVKELQDKLNRMDEEFKSIKGDIGVAKIGAVIRRG